MMGWMILDGSFSHHHYPLSVSQALNKFIFRLLNVFTAVLEQAGQ